MKAIFDIAFMRGELEIDKDVQMVIVPLIANKKVHYEGKEMAIFGNVRLLFEKTEESFEGKPIFELKKISKGDDINIEI